MTSSPAFAAHRSIHASPSIPGTSVTWTFGPSIPFAATRWDGEWLPSQNRVYFLGFRAADNSTDGSVWYYDIGTETFTDTNVDMPVPVSNYGIAALHDATGLGLYIFGGRDDGGIIVDTVQVYYPATNTASTVATDPWPGRSPSSCVTLPAMGVTTLAGKAYVLGGASFSSGGCIDDNSAQTWIFDATAPAGTRWTQGPDLNMARGYVTPAVLGSTIYAVGGDTNVAGTLFPQSIVESWSPAIGGGWNDAGVADLPTPCDESQAFATARGLVAKGFVLSTCGQWPNAIPDTYFYDAVSNSWSDVGAVNETRRNQAGTFIKVGSTVEMFILGGYASDGFTALSSTETGVGSAFAARPGTERPAHHGGGRPTTN
jgi:hypothetical protein